MSQYFHKMLSIGEKREKKEHSNKVNDFSAEINDPLYPIGSNHWSQLFQTTPH